MTGRHLDFSEKPVGGKEKNGFANSVDHKVKNQRKRKDKYVDLARELRKLLNIMATMIPIVIEAFWMASSGYLMSWKLEDESKPSKLQHC